MWSRGLKDVFGLRDVSDDEIMDKVTDEAIKLNDVEDLVFRLLVKYKNMWNSLWLLRKNKRRSWCCGSACPTACIARN